MKSETLSRAFRGADLRFRAVRGLVGPWRAAWVVPLWLVAQRYQVFAGSVEALAASGNRWSEYRRTELEESEIPALLQANPALGAAAVLRRMANGERCMLWWSGTSIAHYRWFAIQPVPLSFVPLEFRPGPNDFYVQEVFTVPDFRRRGLQYLSAVWTAQTALDLGRRRLVGFVSWWNTPSLVLGHRFYPNVGTLTRWNLGFRSIHSATGDVRLDGRQVSVRERRG